MSEPEHEPYVEEDSTENVGSLLERYDRELESFGKLPDDPTDFLLRGPGVPVENVYDLEQESLEMAAKEARELLARDLRAHLRMVGLSDHDSINANNLLEIEDEIIEQLDPINAECLFFEVARQVHARLWEYEPVTWRRLIDHVRVYPKAAESIEGISLENGSDVGPKIGFFNPRGEVETIDFRQGYYDLGHLKDKQRLDDQAMLFQLGIDPAQLQRIASGPNKMAQNINRLAYLLCEEPILQPFVESLKKRAKRGETISVERTLKISKILIKRSAQRLELQHELQQNYGRRYRWDSIDYDVFRRKMRRLNSSMSINKAIEKDIAVTDVDEFLDTTRQNLPRPTQDE